MSTISRPAVDIQTSRAEIQADIKQILAEFEGVKQQNHDQQHSISRNILLVGLSKSGKTTLRHVLTDPQYVAEEHSLQTIVQTVATCDRNIHLASMNVVLNIVELPEQMISEDRNLAEINLECSRLGIQDFHIVCFCISFDTGINTIALQSFQRFVNHFSEQQVKRNLCIIITRCESKDDAQRDRLRQELINDIEFRPISRNLARGIHFSGALNHDDWKRANTALIDQFETIYNYRRSLLDLIVSDIECFHVPEPEPHPSTSFSKNGNSNSLQSNILSLTQSQSSHIDQFDAHRTVSSQPHSENQQLEVPTYLIPDVDTPLLLKDRKCKLISRWFRKCALLLWLQKLTSTRNAGSMVKCIRKMLFYSIMIMALPPAILCLIIFCIFISFKEARVYIVTVAIEILRWLLGDDQRIIYFQ
ncbi:unnamed protein product [Rotaria socialis]|uniref:Uncharacterized protein n=2 Tax=Rotaria socialis TaxID=392032 RepID=A0A818W1D8_9BILA|nr:unnamed protein product [Rotaria socialis]